MNGIRIVCFGLLPMMLGCSSPQNGDRNDCLAGLHINDSAHVGHLSLHAGWQDELPVLISVPDYDCDAAKPIEVPGHLGEKGFEYDHLDVLGSRVVVQLLHRSEGDNTATSFLMSSDSGVSWRIVALNAIDPNAEGIQTLVLRGVQEIDIELFNLDGPTQFISKDNGSSWEKLN